MLGEIVIAAVILLTAGSVVKRLLDLPQPPWLIWPVLLLASAMPAYVGWQVLHPGEAVDRVEIKAVHDQVTLEVPEGYSLLVTAVLREDYDEDQPNVNTTAYALNIRGEGWSQSAHGTMRRKSAGSGPDIDLTAGEGVQESGKTRQGRWGEDLQDRVDLKGSGKITVTVTNWQGLAAEKMILEVVKGPPSDALLWSLVALVVLAGIYLEAWVGVDRVTGDLAFLSMWAVFLRDGVTPLDDFQRIGYSVLPAALLGWGVAAGVAWLAMKYVVSKEAAEAEPEPEPEPVRRPTSTTKRVRGPRKPRKPRDGA